MDILAKKAARAACQKAYYEANKEKIAEQKKAYREANKEKIAEQKKAYYEANKEKLAEQNKAYKKAWCETNKEKIAEQQKAYREANKEKIAEWHQAYRHSNRAIKRINDKRRRDRLVAQNNQTITPEFVKTLFQKAKSCPYCGKQMLDVSAKIGEVKSLDHLVPISKGGLHSQHNVAVCCHSCNAKKHDLDYPEWLNQLDEPHRTRSKNLYIKQYGVSPIQGVLPLVFEV